ncbi:hypothetical protein [Allorhodopirellula solitaria]|uniref:Uncharacterized protein n=1 Tax=Allorhodopirellula solitaria TaxID=2527987 RepID=A0A5C5YIY7_9BACT|nr:hypothetical protein [Allorhodopirellula solitaria]TWT74819.1 hypothetical protein CA85_01050 [Allorhodopirellula solitaria]
MSEFQTIHFAAIDKPLDGKQLAYMEQQSSRADVSRWQYDVEYHYSDFRGNAVEMMRRGYDVHLHYANFGIRKLMFRLPLGLPVDAKTLKRYSLEYCLEWKKNPRGKGGVLSIQPESDGGSYCEDYFEFDRMRAMLPKIRDTLIGGDTRLLYLGWLVCNWDEEVIEPPVPAGLKKLTPELQEFVLFHELDVDLLAAAASASPAISKQADPSTDFDGWLKKQTAATLRGLMRRVLDGDAAAVRAESLAGIREMFGASTWPVVEGTRTLAELRELATGKANTRQQREATAEQNRLEKRLAKLRSDPESAIKEAEKMVETRSTANYVEAAKLLAELRDALPGENGTRLADRAAMRLAKKYPTLSYLKRAFKTEGLNYK